MREKIAISAAVTATSAGLLAACYVYWRRNRLPTQWIEVGAVENIYMSPMKSGFLVEHDEAICDISGMRSSNKRYRDRSFLVVNGQGRFLTARTHPLLTQVKCDVKDNEVVFLFVLNEEIRPLTLNLDELEARKPIRVNYGWTVKRWIKVIDCGDQISEWLTSCIVTQQHRDNPRGFEKPRLVYLTDKTLRDDRGLFFDETSYMLMTQKSLDDLNTRLNSPVTMKRFRPSFVVSGTSKPFEEDNWEWVKIGDVVFKFVKPCLRCFFTTVDPQSGIKDAEKEPLNTLKSYRQITDPVARRALGEAPVFGAHYGLQSPEGHVIRKGDPVYVNVKV